MKTKKIFTDAVFFTVGAVIYAVSVTVFTAPNNIAPGGITGIATVLNFLFGLPIGTSILLINLPLLIISAQKIGKGYMIKSLIGTLAVSAAIDGLTFLNVSAYTGNTMLASIFGGILSGFAISIILMRGGSTGGTDIAAHLLRRRLPHISLGRLILIIDIIIIIFAVIAYRNIESGLYAVISLFAASQVIDSMLYGADRGKLLFIVTKRASEIAARINSLLSRGATVLNSRGAYSGENNGIVMCAVRKNEIFNIKSIIRDADPEAFVIVCDSSETIGEGFIDPEKPHI